MIVRFSMNTDSLPMRTTRFFQCKCNLPELQIDENCLHAYVILSLQSQKNFRFIFRSINMASICYMPHAVNTFVQYFASVRTHNAKSFLLIGDFFVSTTSLCIHYCIVASVHTPNYTFHHDQCTSSIRFHLSKVIVLLVHDSTCCTATFSSQTISYQYRCQI